MNPKDIKWTEAPEGATHYDLECVYPWLKAGDPPAYFHGERGWRLYGDPAAGRAAMMRAVPRPAPAAKYTELDMGAARRESHHIDNRAVKDMADAMRARLAECRAAGKSGWDDPEQCPPQRLADGLVRAVRKGDLIDVANYAAMLLARSKSDMLTEAQVCVMLRAAIDPVPAAPVEWDGTGLPPVGTVCERQFGSGGIWRECQVVAEHWGRVVVWTGNSYTVADLSDLRPILTPEQRAAKERDEAVAAMLADMALDSEVSMRDADAARALYAAGWRKTEGEA